MDCNYFETCSAQMCPLDEDIEKRIWYSDEEICRLRKFTKIKLIRNQKKIKRRQVDPNHYFTNEMLEKNFRITKALKGLAADKEENEELEKWLKNHPILKKVSKGRIELMRNARGAKKRGL